MRIFQPEIRLSRIFQCDYTDKDNLISWLLAFGDRAVLLEPESVREELAASLKRLLALYESDAPDRLKGG